MKKFLSIVLIVLLICTNIQVVAEAAEENNDITVVDYVISKKGIVKGDEFQFGIKLRNTSDYDMKDVQVIVEDGSFYGKNGERLLEVTDYIPSGGARTSPEGLDLIYNGANDTYLHITIMYKIQSNSDDTFYYTKQKKLHVKVDAIPGSEVDGGQIDTKQYKPEINVLNGEIPKGQPGEIVNVKLNLKNNSPYLAKDVIVTPDLGNSPFEFIDLTPVKHVNEISARNSKEVTIRVKIREEAENKAYPIKVNLSYRNDYKDVYTKVEDIFIRSLGSSTSSNVTIKNVNLFGKSVNAGEDFELSLDILNESEVAVENTRVSLIGLKGNSIINKNTSDKIIGKINSKDSKNVKFELHAYEGMSTGNYPVKVKVSYELSPGNTKSFEREYFVKVNGVKSDIIINNINLDKSLIGEGEIAGLSFDVLNIGNKTAENIKVSIIGSDSVVNVSSPITVIDSLDVNKASKINVNLKGLKNMDSGNSSITIRVNYEDNVVDQKVNIYYEGKGDNENNSNPKLIISKYKTNPVIVKAGQNFDLSMTFLNTHKLKTISNIKISIKVTAKSEEDTGNIFTPVDSSNTFFIDEIAPKGTSTVDLTMFTIPDAQSKTYKVDVDMEYEDEDGKKQYTASDFIGIPVRQQSKFMAGDVKTYDQLMVGRADYLQLDINNTGKNKLSNFIVKIEGEGFEAMESVKYVGNIATGERQEFEVEIKPTQAGEISGKLIFTYEEPSGEMVTSEKEFKLNVMEMPKIDTNVDVSGGVNPPIDDNNTLGKKTNKTKQFLIFGGLGVVAVVVLVVVLKKRKKRKGMGLDE